MSVSHSTTPNAASATIDNITLVSSRESMLQNRQGDAFPEPGSGLEPSNTLLDASHGVAPINSLPTDILNMIFSLVVRVWMNEDFQYVEVTGPIPPSALSGVCVLWRSLILQFPVFWSELEIVITGPTTEMCYQRATLWAERSQSAPLHIRVRDAIVSEDDLLDRTRTISPPLTDSDLVRVVDFLTPLMPRIRALKIKSQKHPANNLARALLSCWVRHGSIDTAEKLELLADIDLPELELPGISSNSSDLDLPPDELEVFLGSLRHIRLENVGVNWGHLTYAGLTVLRIDFGMMPRHFPSQMDISNLFTANPMLRSLTLFGVSVRPSRAAPQVPLNHLETLCLETMHAKDLRFILPLISSTSNAIRMALSLDDHPEFISAAQSFFARTKVTVLHVDGGLPCTYPSISPLFAAMPCLHTLVIQICNVSNDVLQDLVRQRVSRNRSANFWPMLRYLHVLQCGTTPELVQELVRILTPQTLWIREYNEMISEGWAIAIREELQESLLNQGIKFVWLKDTDPDPARLSFVVS